jgi:hypothetical protein
MELTLITLIACITVYVTTRYIVDNYKDSEYEVAEEVEDEEIEEVECEVLGSDNIDITPITDELALLKERHRKVWAILRKIVKKLPFTGEEWMQEFVREEFDEFITKLEQTEQEEQKEEVADESEHWMSTAYDLYTTEVFIPDRD